MKKVKKTIKVKGKEKDKVSSYSKNTFLEKESIKKDYEKISIKTEENIDQIPIPHSPILNIRFETLNNYSNLIEKEFLFNDFKEIPSRERMSSENKYNLRDKNISRRSISNEVNPFKKPLESKNNNNIKAYNTNTYNNFKQSEDNYDLMNNNINNHNKSNKSSLDMNTYFNNNDNIYEEEALFMSKYQRLHFRNGLLFGIVKRYEEIKNIVNKIQLIFKKDVKFHLIYRATELGDKIKTFHQMCDNLNSSLVIIETNKGLRFGGFTTKSWRGNGFKKADNNAFVFSIDNNKIYNVIKKDFAIGSFPKFGPVFMGYQIKISDNFFSTKSSTCLKGLYYSTTKDYELNNGDQFYIVKDIEIYSLEL